MTPRSSGPHAENRKPAPVANWSKLSRADYVVYWQQGQALILVGGETGYRKQQAIIVYEPEFTYGVTMSAKVGKWANGVRDTRIG